MAEELSSARQAEALLALLHTASVSEAGRTSGISERTLYRYLAEPGFSERYQAARKAALDDAIRNLQGATYAAVETLVRNMTCGQPATEVRAATAVLDLAFKAREIGELEAKLAEMDAQLSILTAATGA